MKLAGARVLVTGGAGSIGRALVQRLLEAGAQVAVLDRDEAACAALAQAHAGTGAALRVRACDLADVASVESALAALDAEGFETDVLVNNAGLIHSAPLVNLLQRERRVHDFGDWKRVLAANLDTVFVVSGLVVDRMLRRRAAGVVVSVSSVAAAGNAGQSAYAAAKAGVDALTRTWAKELGPMGLRFVSIAPGFLDTPSTHAALGDAHVARLRQAVPLRRLGSTDDVFAALRHAVESDYLTGTVLEVDGGLVL